MSSVLGPRSSVLGPRSSILCPLSSVLSPVSSVLCPLSFILCPMSSVCLSARLGCWEVFGRCLGGVWEVPGGYIRYRKGLYKLYVLYNIILYYYFINKLLVCWRSPSRDRQTDRHPYCTQAVSVSDPNPVSREQWAEFTKDSPKSGRVGSGRVRRDSLQPIRTV